MDVTEEQLTALKLTRSEWDNLEDYEREALLTEEDASAHTEFTDDDIAAAKEVAGEDAQGGEKPGADDAKKADETPPDDDGKKPDEEAGETEGEQPPTQTAVAADDDDVRPTFVPSVPQQAEIDAAQAEFAARRKAIEAARIAAESKLDELDAKADAGEITTVEYNRLRRPIDRDMADVVKKEATLEADMRLHEARVEDRRRLAVDAETQRYHMAQESFYEQPDNATLYQHDTLGEKARHLLVNVFIPALAKMPENGQRSFSWFLRNADRSVRAFLDDEIKAAGLAAAPAPASKKGETPPVRKPDVSKVPVTLGSAPAADMTEAGDEFAHIDSLSGPAYVRALEKLTPEQRERYEART